MSDPKFRVKTGNGRHTTTLSKGQRQGVTRIDTSVPLTVAGEVTEQPYSTIRVIDRVSSASYL